ncbi:hypothetical protein ACFQJD_09165 [Haloplanus sp. GCM10025708]|uniref:hypothetical protein n=1 Tax=Haloferacaceae TaxID=1644056 RepID=UPI003617A0FF
MNRTFGLGVGLSAVSLAGYVVGMLVTYPGRAFAITALMVGITLVAIGGAGGDAT